MTTSRARRRNQYPANCCVCSVYVEAGQGWLYLDTRAGKARGNTGSFWSRFPKKVKCDRCHGLNAAHKCDLPENRPAPPPRLGVDAIRAGKFRLASLPRHRDACVQLVLGDGTAEIVAQLAPITGDPIGVGDCYAEGAICFGRRVLTRAAAEEIDQLGWYAADLYQEWLWTQRELE